MANSSDSLDLYAKVEDLLGVKEAAPGLYAHYLLFLNTIEFRTLLDVGCGSGDFLLQMQQALSIEQCKGIDLSGEMVSQSVKLGIDAACIDLCDLEGTYDVITAVFDMLNYLSPEALRPFLKCVKSHLNDGGIFLCDINTLYGFENVAVGAFIVEDDTRFLAIDSDFEEGEYMSEFTLFEKNGELYKKSQETIRQYCHTVDALAQCSGMEVFLVDDVNLYDLEQPDKVFVGLKKV